MSLFNLESDCRLFSLSVGPTHGTVGSGCSALFSFYKPGVLSVFFILVSLIEQDGISQEEGHSDARVVGKSLGVATLRIDWGITKIMFSHTHTQSLCFSDLNKDVFISHEGKSKCCPVSGGCLG